MVAAGRISRIGGVGLQIIRDCALQRLRTDGLVDESPGAPSKLNADHRRAAEVVEAGPVPAVDGVVRWRRKDGAVAL